MATTTPDIAALPFALFREALPSEDDWQVKPGLNVIRPDGNEWSFDVIAIEMRIADVLIDGSILAGPWNLAKGSCDHNGGKLPLLLTEKPGPGRGWWVWSDTDCVRAPVSIAVVTQRHAWRDRKLFGWKLTPDVIKQLAWA